MFILAETRDFFRRKLIKNRCFMKNTCLLFCIFNIIMDISIKDTLLCWGRYCCGAVEAAFYLNMRAFFA